MPNWIYLFFNALYHLGLALWIGGAVVLSALVAPALFASLPRHQAIVIIVPILRRFARLRLGALLMILAGAGAKVLIWERFALAPWLAVRWTAIVLLAWALLFDLLRTKRLVAFGAGIEPEAAPDDPRRLFLELLYVRAEGLMKASVVAAFFALIFS
ncbi:MAG TPA: DUF4149 domain-containing protein [Thermoanaerobaculia bacterium]